MMWQKLSPWEKQLYNEKAKEAKSEHLSANPGYKYSPRRRIIQPEGGEGDFKNSGSEKDRRFKVDQSQSNSSYGAFSSAEAEGYFAPHNRSTHLSSVTPAEPNLSRLSASSFSSTSSKHLASQNCYNTFDSLSPFQRSCIPLANEAPQKIFDPLCSLTTLSSISSVENVSPDQFGLPQHFPAHFSSANILETSLDSSLWDELGNDIAYFDGIEDALLAQLQDGQEFAASSSCIKVTTNASSDFKLLEPAHASIAFPLTSTSHGFPPMPPSFHAQTLSPVLESSISSDHDRSIMENTTSSLSRPNREPCYANGARAFPIQDHQSSDSPTLPLHSLLSEVDLLSSTVVQCPPVPVHAAQGVGQTTSNGDGNLEEHISVLRALSAISPRKNATGSHNGQEHRAMSMNNISSIDVGRAIEAVYAVAVAQGLISSPLPLTPLISPATTATTSFQTISSSSTMQSTLHKECLNSDATPDGVLATHSLAASTTLGDTPTAPITPKMAPTDADVPESNYCATKTMQTNNIGKETRCGSTNAPFSSPNSLRSRLQALAPKSPIGSSTPRPQSSSLPHETDSNGSPISTEPEIPCFYHVGSGRAPSPYSPLRVRRSPRPLKSPNSPKSPGSEAPRPSCLSRASSPTQPLIDINKSDISFLVLPKSTQTTEHILADSVIGPLARAPPNIPNNIANICSNGERPIGESYYLKQEHADCMEALTGIKEEPSCVISTTAASSNIPCSSIKVSAPSYDKNPCLTSISKEASNRSSDQIAGENMLFIPTTINICASPSSTTEQTEVITLADLARMHHVGPRCEGHPFHTSFSPYTSHPQQGSNLSVPSENMAGPPAQHRFSVRKDSSVNQCRNLLTPPLRTSSPLLMPPPQVISPCASNTPLVPSCISSSHSASPHGWSPNHQQVPSGSPSSSVSTPLVPSPLSYGTHVFGGDDRAPSKISPLTLPKSPTDTHTPSG